MNMLKAQLKSLRNKIRLKRLEFLSRTLREQLSAALDNTEGTPVIVISYNNGKYVKNTCNQLGKYGIKPIIIDNHSTDPATLQLLDDINASGQALVAYSEYNFGHGVGFIDPVYRLLPDIFAYTDPDLAFHADLPSDFIEVLSDLTTEYSVYKAGFALTLNGQNRLKNTTFHSKLYKPFFFERTYTIYELESRYWKKRLQHEKLEVYAAPIDTTFAVYRKACFHGNFTDAVRVADNFSATHLPWFEDMDLFTDDESAAYLKKNRSSTWIR